MSGRGSASDRPASSPGVPPRGRLASLRLGAWYAIAIVLVLMALGAGVMSQLLPWAERNPEQIARWISDRTGRPIAFDELDTEWTRRGPLLRVDGLRIGEGDDSFRIGEAEILVSQYAGLLPGRSFTELRLRGLELTLERGDDGRWSVRGLPGPQQAPLDPFSALEGLGELQVVDGRMHVLAPALDIDATLPKANLRLRVDGKRVHAATRAWMREGDAPIDASLVLDRESGNGKAHASTPAADLSAWSPLLRYAGVSVEGGDGRLQAWARIDGLRLTQVDVDAGLADVVLGGAPLADGDQATRMPLGAVVVNARMHADEDGWRVDAARLRIGAGEAMQTLDGLVVAGGDRHALVAQRIDAAPLLAVAALSDRLDPGLRKWLLDAAPGAILREVEIVRNGDGRMRASASIEDAGFAPVRDLPGASGIGGAFNGDADGFTFRFDSSRAFRFDWPRGFGQVHAVTATGSLSGWREGDGIRVEAASLRVDGDGYGAVARGGLWFQNDGTRPVIDLAAVVDEASLPTAKRFWVRHRMPDAALRWLDTALVGGTVRNGRAVVSGDLDDWPFSALHSSKHGGVFHAEGELSDAVVKFQPDWPAMEGIDGKVDFVDDGFTFSGSGRMAGIDVDRIEASLAHYARAELHVRAGAGDAAADRLWALLRGSPLQAVRGEALDGILMDGSVSATFALDLPLGSAGHRPHIRGTADLRGVKLDAPKWGVAFRQVQGQVRYDDKGFSASHLEAVSEGRAGRLALHAGDGHVADPQQALEVELDAWSAAGDLLDRVPELAWLKPHVAGRSRWQARANLPRSSLAASQGASVEVPLHLQLRSDLLGTRLDLPQPLRKSPNDVLPARIDLQWPLDRNEVAVALGDRLALRARTTAGKTGVRVVLGARSVGEPPPEHGLVVSGRAGALDAMEWIALVDSDGNGGSDGMPLRSVDILAADLRLPGSRFKDTRLKVVPESGAAVASFEGPAITGELRLPELGGATVSGRFSRLHLAMPVKAEASAATTATAPPASDPGGDVDPSAIPPLSIDVDDFRLGELQLGQASLRTQPMADGLRVESLRARSSQHRLDVSGQWIGMGGGARTRLEAALDSKDVGALFEGLGLGTRINGGVGEMKFVANWPRSPAGFNVTLLQGSLDVVIKDGRLVEVEPGAGRVLGLLSVAELPRRLMLDFRDFFSSGFAFNRIAGTVQVVDAQASSRDIVIEGPAADIRVRGRSDLRAQTHDQTIEVTPRTGNLLPAVGAIAGGPVGAAVGAVANAMLKKPLGEMSAKTYRVTGPWKDPSVDVVEQLPSQSASRPPPAPTPDDPAND